MLRDDDKKQNAREPAAAATADLFSLLAAASTYVFNCLRAPPNVQSTATHKLCKPRRRRRRGRRRRSRSRRRWRQTSPVATNTFYRRTARSERRSAIDGPMGSER